MKKILIAAVAALCGTILVPTTIEATRATFITETEEYVLETTTPEAETCVIETTEACILPTETETEEETIPETVATEPELETCPIEIIEPCSTQAETQIQETTTQEQTQQETSVSAWSNVVFKDGTNTYNFNSLDEALDSTKDIKKISLKEAKKQAKKNVSEYKEQIQNLMDLINAYRKENNIISLKANKTLTKAACCRAVESAYSNWNLTGYLDDNKHHIRPNGKLAKTIFDDYDISGSFGENYARYFDTEEETLNGWKSSSAHNALLLSTTFTQFGVGVAVDSEGYYYWIVLFLAG